MTCCSTNTQSSCSHFIHPKDFTFIVFTVNRLNHITFPCAGTTFHQHHKFMLYLIFYKFQMQGTVMCRFARLFQSSLQSCFTHLFQLSLALSILSPLVYFSHFYSLYFLIYFSQVFQTINSRCCLVLSRPARAKYLGANFSPLQAPVCFLRVIFKSKNVTAKKILRLYIHEFLSEIFNA